MDGIVTFRGNNFRDTAAYGNTQIKNGKIQDLWTAKTGSITYGDATWSGSGWTGQPLMEKWSQEVKKSMNMYDWAKEKDDLVEVIYACMDGYVSVSYTHLAKASKKLQKHDVRTDFRFLFGSIQPEINFHLSYLPLPLMLFL